MIDRELIARILTKKAKGYTVRESTDEYAVVEGEKRLVKSKTVTKRVPPDVNAIRALLAMEQSETDVTKLTDEQLQVEKLRLLRLLGTLEASDATSSEEI